MEKQEFSTCRICNECVELSDQQELFNGYTKIAEQIKEVFGVKLIHSTQIPSSICGKCNTDLEIAQEFRRRCVKSNEHFESVLQNIKLEESFIEDEEILVPQPKSEEESEYANYEQVESETNSNTENVEFEQSDYEVELSEKSASTQNDLQKKVNKRNTNKSSKQKVFFSHRRQKEQSMTPIICDICGNVFKRRHVFALHHRRHTNNKSYSCELCSSTFYTTSELKRHMRKHTGEKPYGCRYCSRKFSDYGTHTKHERTHTNDRPFSCTQCDKSFSCGFVLKNHMLTHTGVRAFRCEVCNKSFGRQHNLTTHMKSIYHQKNSLKKVNEDITT